MHRREPGSRQIGELLAVAVPLGRRTLRGGPLAHPPDLGIPEAIDHVVVHHAHGLHVRLDDGRTDEPEPALPKVLAESVRLG